jgi:hypothetical protein
VSAATAASALPLRGAVPAAVAADDEEPAGLLCDTNAGIVLAGLWMAAWAVPFADADLSWSALAAAEPLFLAVSFESQANGEKDGKTALLLLLPLLSCCS